MRKSQLSRPKERVIRYIAHAHYHRGVDILLTSLAEIPMALTRDTYWPTYFSRKLLQKHCPGVQQELHTF
jgi:hypothetical protein